MPPAKSFSVAAPADSTLVAALERIERRFELALRDLRQVRAEIQRDSTSRGVLGSRGLTQFLLEQLQQAAAEHDRVKQQNTHNDWMKREELRQALPARGLSLTDMLALAERTGYQVPTSRTLSKRLTERSYRRKDIEFDHEAGVWFWQGSPNGEEG